MIALKSIAERTNKRRTWYGPEHLHASDLSQSPTSVAVARPTSEAPFRGTLQSLRFTGNCQVAT